MPIRRPIAVPVITQFPQEIFEVGRLDTIRPRVTSSSMPSLDLLKLAGLGPLQSTWILRQVIGDLVPRRAIIDKRVKLRADAGVVVERAHAD